MPSSHSGIRSLRRDEGHVDPAMIAAATRLGVAAALLSGVGLVLLALGALTG